MSKTKYPRSYLVKDREGKLLRRKSHFIKCIKCYDSLSGIEEGQNNENSEIEMSKYIVEGDYLNVGDSRANETKSGRQVKKPQRYETWIY